MPARFSMGFALCRLAAAPRPLGLVDHIGRPLYRPAKPADFRFAIPPSAIVLAVRARMAMSAAALAVLWLEGVPRRPAVASGLLLRMTVRSPRPPIPAGHHGLGRRVPLSRSAVQRSRIGGLAGGRPARVAMRCLFHVPSGTVMRRVLCWLQFGIALKRADRVIEGGFLLSVFPVSLLPLVAHTARESAQLRAFQTRR